MDTRWWVLVFCCTAAYFPNFFELQLSTLVQRLTGTAAACTNTSESCLNFDLLEFNIIVSVYPWARAAAAILAGVLVDQYGSEYVLWGFASSLFLGTLVFTLGAYAATERGAYALMILGRILFGLGTGGYAVVLHRVKTGWFLYRELALAFSTEILFDRLGTASMFLILGALVEVINMRGVMWFAFGLNVVGVGALLVLAYLDRVRTAGLYETSPREGPWGSVWTSLKQFDVLYWLVVLTVFLYDGAVQTFVANAPNFFASVYGLSESTASYIAGIIYDMCLLSPLIGWLADRYGHRDFGILISTTLVFTAFVLELSLYPAIPGAFITFLIGTGYTAFAPLVWSSIPLLALPHNAGLALGTGKFFEYIGSGTVTATAGAILNMTENVNSRVVPWKEFLIYMTVLSLVCVLLSPAVLYFNKKTGGRLTSTQKQRNAHNVVQEPVSGKKLFFRAVLRHFCLSKFAIFCGYFYFDSAHNTILIFSRAIGVICA